MINFTSPKGEICLYLNSAKDYLTHGGDVANYYVGQFIETNQAVPVIISWQTDKKVNTFTIKYSDNQAFIDCKILEVDGNVNEISVYNLLKATEYFVEITAFYEDGATEKATHSFITMEKGPRPLYIDGIYNTRDVGGYLLPSGKRTKQNLLFRGGALVPSTGYEKVGLTQKGKDYMSKTLGVKTEIDFRPPEESESGFESAIPNAKLVYAVLHGYDAIINYAEGYKKLFSILADQDNYPVYMHCTGGADRTGTVCFLINALLGVDEKNLIEDYEFTTFSFYDKRSSTSGWTLPLWVKFKDLINSFNGETLGERIEAMLLSIGITQEEINSLRKIMIG